MALTFADRLCDPVRIVPRREVIAAWVALGLVPVPPAWVERWRRERFELDRWADDGGRVGDGDG